MRHHPGLRIGQADGGQRALGAARRVDADAGLRELHRAAGAAATAFEACRARVVAPGGSQCGLVVHLGAHAPLEVDLAGEREVLEVAGLGLARVGQRAGAGRCAALQQQRVAAAAESGDEDQRARRGGAQRNVQQRQRLRAAQIASGLVLGRHQRAGRDAQLPGHRFVDTRQRRRHHEVRDVAGGHPGVGQAGLQRADRHLHVALVAHPALFPAVVVVVAGFAKMVDQIGMAAVVGNKGGDHVAAADQRGCRAVALDHFLRTGRLGDAALGGHHDGRAFGRPAQRRGKLGQRGAGAGAHVAQRSAFAQADRRGNDAGVQALCKRQRRRCERQFGDRHCACAQQRADSLDRHRHPVFVPVGDRAPALGKAFQARRHPAVLRQHLAALEPQPRQVTRGGQQAVFVGGVHRRVGSTGWMALML